MSTREIAGAAKVIAAAAVLALVAKSAHCVVRYVLRRRRRRGKAGD